jgi:hypothetical protein
MPRNRTRCATFGQQQVLGFGAIELCEITVQRSFDRFEEFCGTTTQAASPQPTLATMASEDVQELMTRV